MRPIRAVQENDVGKSPTRRLYGKKQTISRAIGKRDEARSAIALLFLSPSRLHFVVTMLGG